ncbi:aldehyde dehydrogenase family protein [Salinisphaera hydrothermalis]|uniref:Aldehyde Dehydrogenase n=1 Tax=Salinisphaera hydrothermalis (strain C41B8) TaxID=1304275 RepID=A0A084II38_SALHC|nr:aldehyde dehydrogenase family protein [Salinisphaera hydrothermalis]KEZ76372.1 Aldehyde Dehydrogenase [Salinisphaera hydrothermalis C41B8]
MNTLEAFAMMDYGPAPEDAREAHAWLDAHDRRFDLFIDGQWQPATDDTRFDSHDPASGETLASIASASAADVDRAVAAARKAFPAWRDTPGHMRARYLYALARQIQKHARRLAVLETLDNGKPIRETRDIDIPLVARHFYHHAGWAQILASEFPDHEPLGVAGQVIPWNFPLLMLAWKIAPAIAAGNTVVLKPAEFTSLTALAFAELCRNVGLPDGVVNIVTGAGETGAALVAHPDVDKIAFTGSTEVGREIRRQTADSAKRLTLELGGKSPFIVFDDADLDSAVEGIVDGIWFNQGEVCCAGSRLLVHEAVSERLLAKLRRRMNTLRIGNPLDKAIDIGAIVAPVQLERIRGLVDQAVAEGATCHQAECPLPETGLFYPPTLLTDVGPASTAAQTEIFGPVLTAMTFRTPDEAVMLANNTAYGLAASVWSENINVALELAPRIQAGVVWINTTNRFDAACGFGGYRESGYGREGGREGLAAYLRPAWEQRLPMLPLDTGDELGAAAPAGDPSAAFGIDRTAKLYIGGKQKRPDGGYSQPIVAADGQHVADVSLGNRKDIRDAVEAARAAAGWARQDGHARAQILYYMAENLAQRRDEFAAREARLSGASAQQAGAEIDEAISQAFSAAAWADKYDGAVHNPPGRVLTAALHEPMGVIGIVCPAEAPLLAFVSLALHAIALGNRVVAIPSARCPLLATDFYQVLETSDLPDGVLNIVTGRPTELAPVLADHMGVDALWYFGPPAGVADMKTRSTSNLKTVWTHEGRALDWLALGAGHAREILGHASQVKNVWIPYGE